MLQILNNIYASQVLGEIPAHSDHAASAIKVSQNSELAILIGVLVVLFIGGGFALGCFIGRNQLHQGRFRQQSRSDLKGPIYGSGAPFKQVELPSSIVIPNSYPLIEGLQQGPEARDEEEQVPVEELVPPDLPASHEEESAELVEVESLAEPAPETSPLPSPNEEDSLKLQAPESKPPQAPGPPGLLDPKLVAVLSEMTRRRQHLVKKK